METPGLIPQPIDPRDVWMDELGSEHVDVPSSYKIEGLTYQNQASAPWCVSYAATTMIEHLAGVSPRSQGHLFYNSGGTARGSWFRSNLRVAKFHGTITEEAFPRPPLTYGYEHEKIKAQAMAVPFEGNDPYKINGYVKIPVRRRDLQEAIVKYGPLMIGVSTRGGGYTKPYAKRGDDVDNHAVCLVGWDEDGNWLIFDSLSYAEKWGGYHWLHRDFGFNSAYAITELPENWKVQQEEARKAPFEHCLNHYGKTRDFAKEQRVAAQLLAAFEAFNNRAVMEAAGKFWTVYINAVAYGGYSIEYTKWGKWHPGDVINDCYNWRRTGKHIFDFNQHREDYG